MEGIVNEGIRNIILTSGTLAPLESFAFELRIPFPIVLENPHVIKSSQLWVGVVSKGPSGVVLNSSYKTRDSVEYKNELGNSLVNFARIVPHGLLVFFPSYDSLTQCIDLWKTPASNAAPSIWERICRHKQPIIEPRESYQFNCAIQDFYAKVKDTSHNGAIFFAVCRGKVSEGLDFSDMNGRAVVITGFPYPSLTDAKVKLKRAYLDSNAAIAKESLKGNEWYTQQASRAVNQAVGRVIRHRNDYGAIILCDERFNAKNAQQQLSSWLRPYIKSYNAFGESTLSLSRFFKAQAAKEKEPIKIEVESTEIKDSKQLPQQQAFKKPAELASTPVIKSQQQPAPTMDLTMRVKSKQFKPPKPLLTSNTKEPAVQSAPQSDISKPTKAEETNNDADKRQDAKNFIQLAKQCLSTEDYKKFQGHLKAFKAKELKLDPLVATIQELFNSYEKKDDLLRGFISFIPLKHQKRFEEQLFPSTSKVNLLDQLEEKTFSPPKMRRNTSIEFLKEKKSSTVPMEIEPQHNVTVIETEKKEANVNMYRKTSPISTSRLVQTPASPIIKQKKELGNIREPIEIESDDMEVSVHTVSVKRNASDGMHKEESLAPLVTSPSKAVDLIAGKPIRAFKKPRFISEIQQKKMEPTETKPVDEGESKAPSGGGNNWKCPICQDVPKDPLFSKCGHICCAECWSQALANKLECPVCRAKTREKQLKKLYTT